MSYQAIALDTVLYKMVCGKPQAAFYFGVFGFNELPDYAAYRLGEDAELADYSREAEIVRQNHPGIEDRRFDLYRRWDMLHYLLSEKRRANLPYDETDLMYRAINGGAKLGDDFVLPQGVPITYLTPEEVKEISKALGQISAESLREHWNPPLMREAGVYKIRGDDDESRLEYLLEDFENLKDFYLWTAIFDEGVLVFCD